ncbi:hypothetical protein ACFRCI_16395 [Streptomyces sp. NPDC056638]|uniref:hypothetical protein n=1 Tax=Streptomyces sp. NPDC056638 TaxID=3345887 RepID=UPI0036C22FE8
MTVEGTVSLTFRCWVTRPGLAAAPVAGGFTASADGCAGFTPEAWPGRALDDDPFRTTLAAAGSFVVNMELANTSFGEMRQPSSVRRHTELRHARRLLWSAKYVR